MSRNKLPATSAPVELSDLSGSRKEGMKACKVFAILPTCQVVDFNFELDVLQLPGEWFQSYAAFDANVSYQLRQHRLAEVERLRLNVSRWDETYFIFLLTKSVDIFQNLRTVELYFEDGQVPNLLRTLPDLCSQLISSDKTKWKVASLTRTGNGRPQDLPTAKYQRSALHTSTGRPPVIESLDITAVQLLTAVPWGGISIQLLRANLGHLNYSTNGQK